MQYPKPTFMKSQVSDEQTLKKNTSELFKSIKHFFAIWR